MDPSCTHTFVLFHLTLHSFFNTVIILLYAGHVMGPPLRPDPTTPGYLMDLLAK